MFVFYILVDNLSFKVGELRKFAHINIMLIGTFRQLRCIVSKHFNYLCSDFASRPMNKS
jgi:hypothetical protein